MLRRGMLNCREIKNCLKNTLCHKNLKVFAIVFKEKCNSNVLFKNSRLFD